MCVEALAAATKREGRLFLEHVERQRQQLESVSSDPGRNLGPDDVGSFHQRLWNATIFRQRGNHCYTDGSVDVGERVGKNVCSCESRDPDVLLPLAATLIGAGHHQVERCQTTTLRHV